MTGTVLREKIRVGCAHDTYRHYLPNPAIAVLAHAISDERYQKLQLRDFVTRLRQCIAGKPTGYPYSIAQYIQGDLGRATVLDESVNRPGHVSDDVAASLYHLYATYPSTPRRMKAKPCGTGTCVSRALWRHATHGKPGGCASGARSPSKSQSNTRLNICMAIRLSLLIAALLTFQQAWSAQDRPEMDFPTHARLIYSAPVPPELSRTFGPGWTHLTITRPDGGMQPIIPDEPLTAEGGVIFSTVSAAARSHDGRYVVLDITRNGVTETEDGKPTVASREYCPILDTQTGCVARDYTGAVCGGTWDDQEAVWHSQLDSGKRDSESMATLEKPTARSVWTQFSQAKTTDIKPFLRVALGIENLRACDPPSANNASYFAHIQAALGDPGATSNSMTAGVVPADLTSAPVWTVKVDRSWLYERPSVGSNRHGYLIRGDHVAVIGEEKPDWVRIRYVRAGEAPLEAWLKRQDIAR